MSMCAGVVAVPLIVGGAMGLEFRELAYLLTAALLVSGLVTLLPTLGVWRIGARLPIVKGTSFAAVASMLAIGGRRQGRGWVACHLRSDPDCGRHRILAGHLFNQLLHSLPPVVTGLVITVIGVSLLPVAVRWAGGGVPGTSGFGAPANVGLTLLIILIIYRSYQDSSAGSRSWLAWSSAR